LRRGRWHAWLWTGRHASGPVVLAKPCTFVNSSGLAVRSLLSARGLQSSDLLVVCDDMALEAGRLRLRGKGSDGGHKGLRSIIEHVATQDFARLRIGIGAPPPGMDAVDFVLSQTGPEEREALEGAVARAAACVLAVMEKGLGLAMDEFNTVTEGEQ